MEKGRSSALDRMLSRWQRVLLGLLAIVPCVLGLTLAGAALESVVGLLSRQSAALDQVLILRPRGDSGPQLLVEAERLPGVAGAAAVYSAPCSDGSWEDARWAQATIFAVRSDLPAWRYAPPQPGLRLAAGSTPRGLGEVLVGYELARVLRLRVGSPLWVRGRAFTVAGIWQPAGLQAGNLVQLPYEAAELLFPSGLSLDPIYLQLEPGADASLVLAWLRSRLPEAVALTPSAMWSEERRLARAAALLVGLVAGLTALTSGPAALWPARPLPASRAETAALGGLMGALGGLAGAALAWGVAAALNAAAWRAHALTPLALTPRLMLAVVSWPAACGALAGACALRQRAGRGGRLARRAMATGAIALAVALAIVAGSLEESAAVALERTRAGNAGRLGLEAGDQPLSDALLTQARYLPGYNGMIVEAPGGAVDEDEDGWPGRPPSGMLCGVISPGGLTGASAPYPAGLAQGRSAQGPGEAVVGYELARSRGLVLGSVLDIRGRDFRVVGIRERWPYDALSPINYRVDITLEALRQLLGDPTLFGQATLLVPPVTDPAQRTVYVDRVGRLLGGVRITTVDDRLTDVGLRFPGGRTLTAEAPAARVQGLYQRLFLGALLLALGLAALAAAAALYPQYLEQRRDAALQRLLGAGLAHVLAGYLWQALAIGSLGAVAGASVAWAWARGLNALFHGSAAWPTLMVTPRILAATVALAIVAAVAGSLYPGLRAAAVDPARALLGPRTGFDRFADGHEEPVCHPSKPVREATRRGGEGPPAPPGTGQHRR